MLDPFLFCAYHKDFYPKGTPDLGPSTNLSGRNIGSDFQIKDGFRMYHGEKVPGFPAHPHRGFETVTIVNTGLVDHADSIGAAGRYGNGDVQSMTFAKPSLVAGLGHDTIWSMDRVARDLRFFQMVSGKIHPAERVCKARNFRHK